ncbi:MAG: carboxypeptidase-like regulatory domain-containing protein [Bacteroidales bacterium]|nr:carboxypeptidase-like regulatory domain-containing protein [Bacteroidales bacterium]
MKSLRSPFYIIFLLILLVKAGWGQEYRCSGTVYDAETGRTLVFVNIVTNDRNIGTATDIDGKFSIVSNEEIQTLRLSYVGYKPLTYTISNQHSYLSIHLERSSVELQEVVIIAGENPAHRIIRKVIENRDRNDPEKLTSFAYTSYDVMIFTVDTVDLQQTEVTPSDSSEIRLREYIRDKDFFMTETVSERKFLAPDRNHEKVLATRISGFKDPVFLFLSSQLQSTSFYNEMIRISDKNYINPISTGSLRKYSYNIEDTTFTARLDTVFIISFKPREGTTFDGLTGVLSINSTGWAIQNVIAEPARSEQGLTIRIQQMYGLIDGKRWFPVQLNTDIVFNNVRVNNYAPVGRSKSYISDIELNPELVKRQFNQISIEMHPNAGDRNETFWIEYRGDSLSDRAKNTYAYIDSIGKEANLDRKAQTFKSLINNRIPVGAVDIDLTKIAKYNRYEGFYLGLGLITNQKFSQVIELGGFWGYGFGDKAAKYGGNLGITLDRYREVKLRLSYADYVTETGGVTFFDDKNNAFTPSAFRNFFINRMDKSRRMQAALSFRALRYATMNLQMANEKKMPVNGYQFQMPPNEQDEAVFHDDFTFTEISAGFRFAFKEKFLEMPDARISLGTKFPVVRFNYTRGIDNLLDGQFSYNKFDLKIESRKYFKFLGESKLNLMAGYVDKPIPYTNLYNGRGAYRTFSIYAQDAFVTMPVNEFLSDKYLYAFYTYNFGKLLMRTKRFSPEFAVASNFGIGTLSNPELHTNVDFDTMEQIYCESGVMLNNLLRMPGFYTLGVGVFYRYGYYHLPSLPDNFTYRLTLNLLF